MDQPEWMTQRAEALGDLAGDEQLARFGSVADLAKSYKEMSSYRGRSVPIPSQEAGKEDWNEFYTKFEKVPGMTRIPVDADDEDGWKAFHRKAGAPESPDDYKIDQAALPEGVELDEDLLNAIKPAAHARGVTNKQLNGLFKTMTGVMAKRAEASQQSVEQMTEALKAEWGQAYESKKNAAIGIANRLGGQDFASFLDAHGDAAIHPGLIKTLATIASKFGEDVPIDVTQGSMAITPDDARMQMAEIRSNREHPFNDPTADLATKKTARIKMYELQCYSLGKKPDPEQIKFLRG